MDCRNILQQSGFYRNRCEKQRFFHVVMSQSSFEGVDEGSGGSVGSGSGSLIHSLE